MRTWLLRGLGAILVGFLLIQLVPYGRDHTNPPVTGEPAWDSPMTKALAQRACFDCHSNETVWPWYSNVAPVSWLLQRHVTEGRERLNFSTWGSSRPEVGKSTRLIQDGEMPSWDYLLLHPDARLSDAEKQQLIDGLTRTYAAGGG